MPTKQEWILNPHSPWNAAPNNEPVMVIRADQWRYVMLLALNTKDKGGWTSMPELYKQAVEMKKYFEDNDIPF
jgi:hypothetical protein